ncbi:uncharacterized protein LAESUDRAFT_758638 [Laetiporus sulphureus 93-53]|uniref:BAH-domain-containing protein n=1 Tax=Laetiporus sulphureus 93-53 TaxID=1314785 RepID=A0A165EK96_9APHY|nr:uncharacterized protein LAESUDRAFT_758638 [Laetiporus sulphureus 93-53]KZT07232.1 hypothetical protein LAESUDRAFT_758638 [Laetiporus sulphureus 93-53]
MPPSPSPFYISLKNGDAVKVNDHVYCSPSWSIRDGTPYSVARIMEFLPAQGIPTLDKDGNPSQPFTRVRLAWYYRPSDVSDRASADCRLLLAAIFSEVCDLSQIRGKCYVLHRDKISDLAGWKKRPDRFYFTRLFDPWIRKEFEVIPSTIVRNLPEHIRKVLVERYEYVVAEKEVVPDLTDTLRTCETCTKWCAPAETVQCDRCKKFFHMSCVNPPLLAKPSRGYGWTCAPCSRKHEEEVDSHEGYRQIVAIAPRNNNKSNAPPARGRGRPRKDRMQAEKEENMEIKHFKMWPFRYFGQYTVAEDTLDPDDLIFPRATTRVGPKYQANVPLAPGVENIPIPGIEERGGDATIEVLCLVQDMSSEEVSTLEKHRGTLTKDDTLKCSVDWLTEVMFRFTDAWLAHRDLTTVSMKNPMRVQKWKTAETRYIDKEWTNVEIAAFEDAIATHGAELRPVRDEVGTRTMPETVRFYGHWKNSKLGEENARIRAARLSGKPQASSRAASPDDEGSVVKQLTKGNTYCGCCRTRESEWWWKAPKGLPTNVLCDNCGMSWRKYADLNVRPFREETISKSKNDKREGTPLNGHTAKRAKTTSSSHSTPPPAGPAPVPQLRCLACQKNGPIGKVLKCKQCQFRVHAGSCGAVLESAEEVESWVCELCANEKTLEASLNSDCLLCPRSKRDSKKALYPPPDTYLRACKPTEGQAWVHIVCSVFIPEVTYSDATRLRLVEGISTIPSWRWSNKCTICNQSGGAVIRCSECPAEYHVSCAWRQGHKFGFEVQPVKHSKRETTTMVEFKDSAGCMVPVVICKGHMGYKREVFDLCETNELGETSLQVYCKNYKQVPTEQTHGLLRKARRLDNILNAGADSLSTISGDGDLTTAEPQCYHCHSEFSPFFHAMPSKGGSSSSQGQSGGRTWLCHQCFVETRENHVVTNGMVSA